MARIADCVRENAVLADIGTDHGKLPVYLAQTGKICRAVAADINEMPLQKAMNNINKYGLTSAIETYLTDGLHGVERFCPTDVVIAGMGGELIEQILQEQTIDKTGVKYILQPMTKEEREFLCENGYTIVDEHIVEEGKIYQIICAEYTGEFSAMTPAEYLLGRINIAKGEPLLENLTDKVIARQKVKIEGKHKAGQNVDCDAECLDELLMIKENCYGKR